MAKKPSGAATATEQHAPSTKTPKPKGEPDLKLAQGSLPDKRFTIQGTASLIALAVERLTLKHEIKVLEEQSAGERLARNDAQEQFDGILATIKADARKGPTQTEGQELVRLQEVIQIHDRAYEEVREQIREKRARRTAIPDEQTKIMAKEMPDNTLFKDFAEDAEDEDGDEDGHEGFED